MPAPPRITIITRLMLSSRSKDRRRGGAQEHDLQRRRPCRRLPAEIAKIASLWANTLTPRAAATVSSWRMAARSGRNPSARAATGRGTCAREHGQRQPVEAHGPAEIERPRGRDRAGAAAGCPASPRAPPVRLSRLLNSVYEDDADAERDDDEEVAAQAQAGQADSRPATALASTAAAARARIPCLLLSMCRGDRRRCRQSPYARARPGRCSRTGD